MASLAGLAQFAELRLDRCLIAICRNTRQLDGFLAEGGTEYVEMRGILEHFGLGGGVMPPLALFGSGRKQATQAGFG